VKNRVIEGADDLIGANLLCLLWHISLHHVDTEYCRSSPENSARWNFLLQNKDAYAHQRSRSHDIKVDGRLEKRLCVKESKEARYCGVAEQEAKDHATIVTLLSGEGHKEPITQNRTYGHTSQETIVHIFTSHGTPPKKACFERTQNQSTRNYTLCSRFCQQ